MKYLMRHANGPSTELAKRPFTALCCWCRRRDSNPYGVAPIGF